MTQNSSANDVQNGILLLRACITELVLVDLYEQFRVDSQKSDKVLVEEAL